MTSPNERQSDIAKRLKEEGFRVDRLVKQDELGIALSELGQSKTQGEISDVVILPSAEYLKGTGLKPSEHHPFDFVALAKHTPEILAPHILPTYMLEIETHKVVLYDF